MKKTILISLTVLLTTIYYSQNNTDYSLAKSGIRISGMYVFIGCEPANEYDYAGDIKVNDFAWTKTTYFEKIVKKAKKKYPAANGIIYRQNTPKKAEIITFRELEKAGGGFRTGDIVKAIISSNNSIEGTVVQINNVKNKVRVEYLEDGESVIKWFNFKDVVKNS
tara:strand:+ start:1262 stop:1756 length:495 start_codon:yes stop_codon:yes gene_type:complete